MASGTPELSPNLLGRRAAVAGGAFGVGEGPRKQRVVGPRRLVVRLGAHVHITHSSRWRRRHSAGERERVGQRPNPGASNVEVDEPVRYGQRLHANASPLTHSRHQIEVKPECRIHFTPVIKKYT